MSALIVDDQEQNLYLLRALLGGYGYDVEEARHGAEALAKARQHRPDIVISDLLMPVMDGFTLLRQWKADASLKDIPFVVYTATYTAPEDETLALDLGADAFIVKPAEPEPFVARIGALLSAASAGTMPAARPPAADERAVMKEYSEALVRKLEDKLLALEASIADRTRAEEALRQSEERYRQIVELAEEGMWRIDENAVLTFVNRKAADMCGYAREEMLGRTIYEFMFEADLPTALGNQQRRREGVHERLEIRYRRRDGSAIWALVASTPLFDREGRYLGALGTASDITERKRAEEALRESEARLNEAQRNARIGSWRYQPDGTLNWSDEMFELFRLPRDVPLTREAALTRIHPEDLAAGYGNAFTNALESGVRDFEVEYRVVWPDGSIRTLHGLGEIHRDADGQVVDAAGTVQDITERRRAEAERGAAARRFETVFLGAPEAMSVSELESGRILQVNNAFCKMFGHAREALVGRSALDIGLWSNPGRREVVVGKVRAGERVVGMEGQARTRSGELRETLFSADRIDFGDTTCLLLMFVDVTERRRAQVALEQANLRLHALSTRLLDVQEQERAMVARELHDELGQMLTAIMFQLESLRRGAGRAIAEGIDRSVNVIAEALRQVRSLSLGLRPPELDDLGLAAALRGHIRRVFRTTEAPRVSVDIDGALPPLPPHVAIACFRIAQEALTNVLRHAQARQVRVSVALRETQLELEVVDDGLGFEVERARDAGSIGLSSMAERAQIAGGSLQIDSGPGAGTRVKASFTLDAAAAAS